MSKRSTGLMADRILSVLGSANRVLSGHTVAKRLAERGAPVASSHAFRILNDLCDKGLVFWISAHEIGQLIPDDRWIRRMPRCLDGRRVQHLHRHLRIRRVQWRRNSWYANNWQMDLAVTGVDYIKGDPANGALVKVEARDRLIMPATLRVSYADGTHRDIRLPAETWIRQAMTAIPLRGPGRIVRAELDPDHRLPDRDRGNNVMIVKS